MKTMDVVIIGGGVIGASIAYHLTRAGVRDVVLLERNELATAASSRAAGLVLEVTGKPAKQPLVHQTLADAYDLEEMLGEDIGFRRVGSLRVAQASDRIVELDRMAKAAEQTGVRFAWLTPQAAGSRVPWLATDETSRYGYFQDDAFADPYRLAMAYAKAAQAGGVSLKPRTSVFGIEIEQGRAVAVTTSEGRIASGSVVNAAGAWANALVSPVDQPLAFTPVRSHYWLVPPTAGYPPDHPITVLPDVPGYTRPELGGLLVGVQENRSLAFDARTLAGDETAHTIAEREDHWDVLIEKMPALSALAPEAENWEIAHYVAGLSCYTPDGLFLLGASPNVEGLYVAAGCCGSGVAASGGIGVALSERVTGSTLSYDLGPFALDRFGSIDPNSTEFQARCTDARAHKATGSNRSA